MNLYLIPLYVPNDMSIHGQPIGNDDSVYRTTYLMIAFYHLVLVRKTSMSSVSICKSTSSS